MATAYFHGRLLEYFSYQHDSPWLQPNETQAMITGLVLSVVYVGLKMKSLVCSITKLIRNTNHFVDISSITVILKLICRLVVQPKCTPL